MSCENPSCPNQASEVVLQRCSGCSSSVYCSQTCQAAEWPNHKKICKLLPPAHLKGFSLNVTRMNRNCPELILDDDEEEEEDDRGEDSLAWLKVFTVNIKNDEWDTVRHINVQVITPSLTIWLGFL
ncbi:hypothetical protein JAAARDRAFT_32735 [Jaapia argillacea MUCL 33604]|uniref:MYND-type domain-containing protein n=1 Tax=Jaapia argillacea MUCL 33604 TaxID=933084 RepID=A0A067QCP2_9AGAM|nr:hypothetical protein JAAARDRAFT_32735 [Jaapia argillacea MUCL 33604]